MPLQSIHVWQDLAKSQYELKYSIENPSSPEEKAKLEANAKEYWGNASWSYVYKTEILPDIWLYVGAALLIPIFMYGLLSEFIALVIWLYRGFF